MTKTVSANICVCMLIYYLSPYIASFLSLTCLSINVSLCSELVEYYVQLSSIPIVSSRTYPLYMSFLPTDILIHM